MHLFCMLLKSRELDAAGFLEHAEGRLSGECERVANYMDPNTRRPLLRIVEDRLLRDHVKAILEKGFDSLVRFGSCTEHAFTPQCVLVCMRAACVCVCVCVFPRTMPRAPCLTHICVRAGGRTPRSRPRTAVCRQLLPKVFAWDSPVHLRLHEDTLTQTIGLTQVLAAGTCGRSGTPARSIFVVPLPLHAFPPCRAMSDRRADYWDACRSVGATTTGICASVADRPGAISSSVICCVGGAGISSARAWTS
eukprot:COSAG01_NODE_3871_length_5604_cov_15.632334_9_plen_250_part_00